MTAEEIAGLRELCEKATPGPWDLCTGESFYHLMTTVCHCTKDESDSLGFKTVLIADCMPRWFMREAKKGRVILPEDHVPNMQFIAAARTALPALLDEVERLQAEVKHLQAALLDAYDCIIDAAVKHPATLEEALEAGVIHIVDGAGNPKPKDEAVETLRRWREEARAALEVK